MASRPMSHPSHDRHWILDIELKPRVALQAGDIVDRDAFLGWMWAEWGEAGLVGVDEGSLDVAEAAALGLIATDRVIDAAARGDRDWLACRGAAGIACWFADEAAARSAAARLAGLDGARVLGTRPTSPEPVADWRAGFDRIDVPGFGTILPAWEEGVAGHSVAGTTMFIDPGAGFGTGSHETTRLCLAQLGRWHAAGGALNRVLDFGSGSGILGIAAAVRGAEGVDAVEIDAFVHGAIRANAARNAVLSRVRVMERLPEAALAHDLVLANVVAPVLLEHAEAVCGRVRPAGRVVLSGLLAADVGGVGGRYAALLGGQPETTADGDWHCLAFTAAG